MTSGGANNCGSARRCNACWNVDRLPIRGMNCLGMPSRETGHSRVPEPPARSTGRMRGSAMALCYADLRRQEGNPDCLAGLRAGVDFKPKRGIAEVIFEEFQIVASTYVDSLRKSANFWPA